MYAIENILLIEILYIIARYKMEKILDIINIYMIYT